jgi:uncharacterized protein YlxW (UPF0749 family)
MTARSIPPAENERSARDEPGDVPAQAKPVEVDPEAAGAPAGGESEADENAAGVNKNEADEDAAEGSDAAGADENPAGQGEPSAGEAVEDQPAVEEPGDGVADNGGSPRPRRLTAATGIMALLLALLGFTFVVQVRSVAVDPTLAAARQEDLVRILTDLDAHEDRLRQDIAELEETRSRLTTAGESQQEALAEAARRADELGILAGTLPAAGPGLTVEIRAGIQALTAATLLDAVQEMRGAGAEAIQITDGSGGEVRVVASTYFLDHERGVVVDGVLLRSPYTVTVIGEPETVAPALRIPGGVVEKVHGAGGTVAVHEEPAGVEVTVVREPAPLQYARPVS